MEILNILDYIFIAAIILGAFIGLSRGFMGSLFNFAGKILAAYLSVKFLQPFMEYFRVKDLFLRGMVDIVIKHIPLSENIKNVQVSREGLELIGPELGNNMVINIMGDTLSGEWDRFLALGEKMGLSTVGEIFSLVTANYILNIISFLVLFLLLIVAFSIIKNITAKLLSLSNFVSGIDKILGFFLGAAIDIFIIALITGFSFDILNLIALPDDSLLGNFKNLLNESYLQSYFYSIYELIISEGTKLL